MKLSELNPRLVRREIRDGSEWIITVETMEKAQGLWFLCPKCFEANGGAVGTHAVLCWSRSRGIPEDAKPGPGRWALEGTGIHDLTLGAEPGQSRSVALNSGCAWHGFITNGEVATA